jgi:outer membrane protein assembly factor BamB
MRPGLCCAALSAALLAGCNPFAKTGPQPAELEDIPGAREVKLLWSAELGTGEPYILSPALAGDAVYVASYEGNVARLDASNGRQLWRSAAASRLAGGVGADARTVAVATEDGEVVALDAASGAVRWRARVSSEVLAAPTVSGGLVIVRSIDSRIFAFEEQDGKRRWVYQRSAPSLMVRSPAGVTVGGDMAFAGFSGGKLAAIALSNGGARWEVTVALPKGSTELERIVDILGDPAVQGREVCVAAYQGRVACYEAANGRQSWVRDMSSLTGVSLDARFAYVSDDRGAVHELDRSNGSSTWKQDKLRLRQPTQPQAAGSIVVVGDFEGYVHFLQRDTGAFIARYYTFRGPIRTPPLPLAAGFLVQTQYGGLFALGL